MYCSIKNGISSFKSRKNRSGDAVQNVADLPDLRSISEITEQLVTCMIVTEIALRQIKYLYLLFEIMDTVLFLQDQLFLAHCVQNMYVSSYMYTAIHTVLYKNCQHVRQYRTRVYDERYVHFYYGLREGIQSKTISAFPIHRSHFCLDLEPSKRSSFNAYVCPPRLSYFRESPSITCPQR